MKVKYRYAQIKKKKKQQQFRECVGRTGLQGKLKEVLQAAISEFRC